MWYLFVIVKMWSSQCNEMEKSNTAYILQRKNYAVTQNVWYLLLAGTSIPKIKDGAQE